MKDSYKLIYIGDDVKYFDNLKMFCSLDYGVDLEISKEIYNDENFINLIVENRPYIIFWDFTRNFISDEMIEKIVLLKKLLTFKKVLFTAILGDTINRKDMMLLFSSGFQFSHIKGFEAENFFSECIFMCFGYKIKTIRYAKATHLDLETKVGICSTLTKMSLKNFCLDSDVLPVEESISFELDFFPDLKTTSFKINSHENVPLRYPMMESYILEYPFLGSWEKESRENLDPDTLETWIDSNLDSFNKNIKYIKVYTGNEEIFNTLYEQCKKCSLQLDLEINVDLDNLSNQMRIKRFGMIFLDLNESFDINLNILMELIKSIKKIEFYRPIVIIFNNLSKSAAMKKVYDYENIVCLSEQLSKGNFKLFTDTYETKSKDLAGTDYFFFKNSDNNRVVDIYENIKITSLAENEITFLSAQDLPFFTIIHLYLPIDCFVTIIPSIRKLENQSYGKHYLGKIHGISEDERQVLRKFVNQIIFRPIEKLSKEIVEATIKQVPPKKDAIEEIINEEKEVEETIDYKTFKRRIIHGRSKL